MGNLSEKFYKKLYSIANEVGMSPDDILIVMASESNLNASGVNKDGGASGIVQFMPKTLQGLGFKGSPAQFRALAPEDQLDYVRKLIIGLTKYNGAPIKSATQYYIANFVPAALKLEGVKNSNPNTIILAKNPKKPTLPNVSIKDEMRFYNANSGLDSDKDGFITFKDMQAAVAKASKKTSFIQGLADLEKHTGFKSKNNYGKVEEQIKSKPIIPQENNTILTNIQHILQKYLSAIASTEQSNINLYKKYLPEKNILINIGGKDLISNEYALVLSSILDSQIYSNSEIYFDENNLQIKCSTYGSNIEDVIYSFANMTKESFIECFGSAPNIKISNVAFKNKLSLKTAYDNHLKFINKTGDK